MCQKGIEKALKMSRKAFVAFFFCLFVFVHVASLARYHPVLIRLRENDEVVNICGYKPALLALDKKEP